MSKHNASSPMTSKILPPGSYRTRKADGTRVWIIRGKEFASKRAYYEWMMEFSKNSHKPETSKRAAPEIHGVGDGTVVLNDKLTCEVEGGKVLSVKGEVNHE